MYFRYTSAATVSNNFLSHINIYLAFKATLVLIVQFRVVHISVDKASLSNGCTCCCCFYLFFLFFFWEYFLMTTRIKSNLPAKICNRHLQDTVLLLTESMLQNMIYTCSSIFIEAQDALARILPITTYIWLIDVSRHNQ